MRLGAKANSDGDKHTKYTQLKHSICVSKHGVIQRCDERSDVDAKSNTINANVAAVAAGLSATFVSATN